MKKLSTTVLTKNNEEKVISVWVDELTEKALEAVDEATRHQYIIDEYRVYLSNRKETRRHQSLDYSMDNGFDFPASSPTPEEYMENMNLSDAIEVAFLSLNLKQQYLFDEIVFKHRTKRDVANEFGVSESAVGQQFDVIQKKLEKF